MSLVVKGGRLLAPKVVDFVAVVCGSQVSVVLEKLPSLLLWRSILLFAPFHHMVLMEITFEQVDLWAKNVDSVFVCMATGINVLL